MRGGTTCALLLARLERSYEAESMNYFPTQTDTPGPRNFRQTFPLIKKGTGIHMIQ